MFQVGTYRGEKKKGEQFRMTKYLWWWQSSVYIAILSILMVATNAHAVTIIDLTTSAGIDVDVDGFPDLTDNCIGIANSQANSDGDGLGDVCDPDPVNPGPFPAQSLDINGLYTIGAGDTLDVTVGFSQLPSFGDNGFISFSLGGTLAGRVHGGLTGITTVSIPASFFVNAGWDLNTPGTYDLTAQASTNFGTTVFVATTVDVASIPEPSTLLLLGFGLAGLGLVRRRRVTV